VRRHISLNEYSAQEIQDVWLSPEEYKNIRKTCAKHVMMMDRLLDFYGADKPTVKVPSVSFCSRGLEYHTSAGARIKQMNRNSAIGAVLDEQYRQVSRLAQIDIDDEAIRNVYRDFSYSSELGAHRMGLFDHQEAEEIYHGLAMASSISSSVRRRSGTSISKDFVNW
jgi:hypothetical protein